MCQYSRQDKWKEYITRGNTEFSLQYYGNAILMYQQALDSAKYKFSTTAQDSLDQAISKVVICYFNLADCYIKLEQIDRACDFYTQAQSFLIQVNQATTYSSGGSSGDSSEARFKAVSHADLHMNQVWSDFIKKYRNQVGYERMKEYHRSSLVLKNESVLINAICH